MLDAVVDHLQEIASAAWTCVDVAMFDAGVAASPAPGPGNLLRRDDRVEAVDGYLVPTDHPAVSAVVPPYTAAGSGIDVVNAFWAVRRLDAHRPVETCYHRRCWCPRAEQIPELRF